MKKKNVYKDHQRIEKGTKGKLGRNSVVRTKEIDQDMTSNKTWLHYGSQSIVLGRAPYMFPVEPKGENEVGLSLKVRVKWHQLYGKEEYSDRELVRALKYLENIEAKDSSYMLYE